MAGIHESHSSLKISISAPAKINLTLETLRKRPDGYHEIRSVMQTISLSDTLIFQPVEGITIKSDNSEWDGNKSLVSQAVKLLKERTGCTRGANIFIQKRIPWFSGLGGDSSDAAATLTGLNRLWGLGQSREELMSLGGELGSDVVFFFHGGTALAEGRGEIITPLPMIPHRWIVLLIPDIPQFPGKTRLAYQNLKPDYYTDGRITDEMVAALRLGQGFDVSLMFNVFERIIFSLHPELENSCQNMLNSGAPNVHLAGSGMTLFSLLDDSEKAKSLLSKLEMLGEKCYIAETR